MEVVSKGKTSKHVRTAKWCISEEDQRQGDWVSFRDSMCCKCQYLSQARDTILQAVPGKWCQELPQHELQRLAAKQYFGCFQIYGFSENVVHVRLLGCANLICRRLCAHRVCQTINRLSSDFSVLLGFARCTRKVSNTSWLHESTNSSITFCTSVWSDGWLSRRVPSFGRAMSWNFSHK